MYFRVVRLAFRLGFKRAECNFPAALKDAPVVDSDLGECTGYTYEDEGALTCYLNKFKAPDSQTYHSSAYYHAKALFDAREFDKVHTALSKFGTQRSSLLTFLRLYSQFIAGDLRAHNPVRDIFGRLADNAPQPNSALESIWDELNPQPLQSGSERGADGAAALDPFCLYLLGIVALRLGLNSAAQQALVDSIRIFPYNWSAWLELGKSISSPGEWMEFMGRLPQCIMLDFFWMHMDSEFSLSPDQLERRANRLLELFPNSQTVRLQKALALYHYNHYALALPQFESAFRADAYLLDYADVFSHILFLLADLGRLGWLASRCVKVDRLRPETCCVVGNFYAAHRNHEKALSYFSRAIQLDGGFQTAWILAGHCLVELQNLSTATSAFSRAIAIRPKDYRAFVGLASVYELLAMRKEAIHYYKRAVALKPGDARLWHALGDLYLAQRGHQEAVKCFERCLDSYMATPDLHLKLGELYEMFSLCGTQEDSRVRAAYHYRQGLTEPEPHSTYSILATKALYFLAEYEMSRGEHKRAGEYCSEALNHSSYARPRGLQLATKIGLALSDHFQAFSGH
ncbi:Anaphase-promoting complex subunit 8 [Massospora cicadina]|nr:Anaphase-promoting complex subunit 8 [Massospora cicadina]